MIRLFNYICMKITTKQLPKSALEITISAEAAELVPFREEAIKEIGQHVKVDGFRPGKIPEDKLIEKVGEETVQKEAIDRAVKKFYMEAVVQEKIQVVAPPAIEVTSADPLEFTATVATMPEVEVGDYKKISIKKEDDAVTDKELNDFVAELQKRHATAKSVEGRAAKMGDRAEIDFAGSTPDGVPLDNTASKNHPLELGSNSFIPGFEEGIVGMNVDEEKEIKVTFTEDYHAKQLAGKPVVFKVKLHKIEEMEEPQLDDDFAAKVKEEGAKWVDVEKDIREYLGAQKKQAAQGKLEDALMQELLKIAKVEIPDALIQEETTYMLAELKQRLTQGGMTFESYLEQAKKTEEEIKEEMKEEGGKRVTIRLVINKLIELEDPQITDEEFKNEVHAMAHRGKPEDHDKIMQEYDALSPAGQRLKHQMRVMKLLKDLTTSLSK